MADRAKAATKARTVWAKAPGFQGAPGTQHGRIQSKKEKAKAQTAKAEREPKTRRLGITKQKDPHPRMEATKEEGAND